MPTKSNSRSKRLMILSMVLLGVSVFFYPQTKGGLGIYLQERDKSKSEVSSLKKQINDLKNVLGDSSPYNDKKDILVGPANKDAQINFIHRIKEKAVQESVYVQNIRINTNNLINPPASDVSHSKIHKISFVMIFNGKDYEGLKRFTKVFDEFPFSITSIKINYPNLTLEGELFGK